MKKRLAQIESLFSMLRLMRICVIVELERAGGMEERQNIKNINLHPKMLRVVECNRK